MRPTSCSFTSKHTQLVSHFPEIVSHAKLLANSSMASKIMLRLSLLFLARLTLAELQFAERVPQLLQHRDTFIGGISLFAETPDSGTNGVCPSYLQTVPGSCCPDGCCPIGTYGYIHGDYCCPTGASICNTLVVK